MNCNPGRFTSALLAAVLVISLCTSAHLSAQSTDRSNEKIEQPLEQLDRSIQQLDLSIQQIDRSLQHIDGLIQEGTYSAAFDEIRVLENSPVPENPNGDVPGYGAELLWRKAWAMVNRTRLEGSHLSKNDLIADYEKALNWAGQAIELSPDSSRAWYWYGVAAGALGEQKGVFAALREIDEVRNSMIRSIALDPAFSDPWITLARLYDALPGIMGGDRDAAVLLARVGLSASGDEQGECRYSGRDIDVLRTLLEERNYSAQKRSRLAERRREDPDWLGKLLPDELQGLIPFIRNHPGTIHPVPCTPGLSDREEAGRLPGAD